MPRDEQRVLGDHGVHEGSLGDRVASEASVVPAQICGRWMKQKREIQTHRCTIISYRIRGEAWSPGLLFKAVRETVSAHVRVGFVFLCFPTPHLECKI